MGTLGTFEIGRVLGMGGSGTVYAARQSGSTEEIALKVLREDTAVTERERARFMDEAARMRRVTHPSLVHVIDAGFLPDGRPYVAMPLLNGESLSTRILRGRIPLDQTMTMFADICGAVSTLHAAGLVHRDIKPENVIVTEREGTSRATLLDLGIARDIDAPASTTTKLGNVRGTPAYMAPERFFGKPASVATDVYELGVTLYMMVTAKLPWASSEDASERLTPAHPMRAGIVLPEEMSRVMLRALSMKPEERPQRAEDFLREVQSAASADAAMVNTQAPTAAFGTVPPPGSSSQFPANPAVIRSGAPGPYDAFQMNSTAIAPHVIGPAMPVSLAPQSSGRGAIFAVIGGAGVLIVFLMTGAALAALFLFRGSSATVEPTSVSAVVTVVPPISATPTPGPVPQPTASVVTPTTATPKHPGAPTPHPSASGSSGVCKGMSSCEMLMTLYCDPLWKAKHGTGDCSGLMSGLPRIEKEGEAACAQEDADCHGKVSGVQIELGQLRSASRGGN